MLFQPPDDLGERPDTCRERMSHTRLVRNLHHLDPGGEPRERFRPTERAFDPLAQSSAFWRRFVGLRVDLAEGTQRLVVVRHDEVGRGRRDGASQTRQRPDDAQTIGMPDLRDPVQDAARRPNRLDGDSGMGELDRQPSGDLPFERRREQHTQRRCLGLLERVVHRLGEVGDGLVVTDHAEVRSGHPAHVEPLDPWTPQGRGVAAEVRFAAGREEDRTAFDSSRLPAGQGGEVGCLTVLCRSRRRRRRRRHAGPESPPESDGAGPQLGERPGGWSADQRPQVAPRSAGRRRKEQVSWPVLTVIDDIDESDESHDLARRAQQPGGLEGDQSAERVTEQPVRAARLVPPDHRHRKGGHLLDGLGIVRTAQRTERQDGDDGTCAAQRSGQRGELVRETTGPAEDKEGVGVSVAELDARHVVLFARRRVIRRAANSSPYMNRISGPNVIAPAMPTKKSPGAVDSKSKSRAGA